MLSTLPLLNPFKESGGINTEVQIAKTAHMQKKKQLLEATVSNTSQDTNLTTARTVENTNINWWLICILCLMSGGAIPTYGQATLIKKLERDLKHERTRPNKT